MLPVAQVIWINFLHLLHYRQPQQLLQRRVHRLDLEAHLSWQVAYQVQQTQSIQIKQQSRLLLDHLYITRQLLVVLRHILLILQREL